jgi:hypothetical protein
MNTAALHWPSRIPRVLPIRRKCPLCTSIEFKTAEPISIDVHPVRCVNCWRRNYCFLSRRIHAVKTARDDGSCRRLVHAHLPINSIPYRRGFSTSLRGIVCRTCSTGINRPVHLHIQKPASVADSSPCVPLGCIPGATYRIGSRQSLFNPHTSTALAAQRKSPYQHRSASDPCKRPIYTRGALSIRR